MQRFLLSLFFTKESVIEILVYKVKYRRGNPQLLLTVWKGKVVLDSLKFVSASLKLLLPSSHMTLKFYQKS